MVELGVCDQKRGLDCFSKLSVGIQLEIFKKQSFYCQLPIDTFFVLGCSIFQKFDTKEKIRKTVLLRLGPIFSCASSWGWKTRTDFESTLPKLSDNKYMCRHPQTIWWSEKSRFKMELSLDILQSGQLRIPDTIELERQRCVRQQSKERHQYV